MEKIKQYLIDFQKRKFEIFDRELKIKFTKEFITYNQEKEIKEDKYKIQVIPVWKWLLADEKL
jgi:predicted AAA+ superfamily ATPase